MTPMGKNSNGEALYDRVYPTTFDEVKDEYMAPIDQALKILNRIGKDREKWSAVLSYCDMAISDIRHYRELENPTAPIRAKLTKKEIEILQRRRVAKYHLYLIKKIGEAIGRSSMLADLQGVSNALHSVGCGHYIYRTNILEDIDPSVLDQD